MCWFVAYTKRRSEFKALDYFTRHKINAYVPEYIALREWSDRIKKTRKPAITGYIFFELNSLDYDLLNTNPYTRSVVKSLGSPIIINETEIRLLKDALKCYSVKKDFQYGDFVKIGNGPFKNKLGKVDDVNENYITILLNSIRVKLALSSSRLSLAV